MDCPKCHEPMFVIEYESVEIDVCDECGGVWLDSGELELVLGQTEPPPRPDKVAKPARGEKLLDCPVCVAKLVKAPYGTSPVIVDRCPYADGVFLDKGELEAIQAHYHAAEKPDGGTDDLAGQFLRKFFTQE